MFTPSLKPSPLVHGKKEDTSPVIGPETQSLVLGEVCVLQKPCVSVVLADDRGIILDFMDLIKKTQFRYLQSMVWWVF